MLLVLSHNYVHDPLNVTLDMFYHITLTLSFIEKIQIDLSSVDEILYSLDSLSVIELVLAADEAFYKLRDIFILSHGKDLLIEIAFKVLNDFLRVIVLRAKHIDKDLDLVFESEVMQIHDLKHWSEYSLLCPRPDFVVSFAKVKESHKGLILC